MRPLQIVQNGAGVSLLFSWGKAGKETTLTRTSFLRTQGSNLIFLVLSVALPKILRVAVPVHRFWPPPPPDRSAALPGQKAVFVSCEAQPRYLGRLKGVPW